MFTVRLQISLGTLQSRTKTTRKLIYYFDEKYFNVELLNIRQCMYIHYIGKCEIAISSAYNVGKYPDKFVRQRVFATFGKLGVSNIHWTRVMDYGIKPSSSRRLVQWC